jgi:DNA repair protein RecO (recombination protein O)
MTFQDTEAIVLSTADLGESDRLVTCYTRGGGKISGIAKGARRSRRRFVHSLETCSVVAMRYRERRASTLVWIDSCELLEPHLELREDLHRWGYAAFLAEVAREMTAEGVVHEALFQLLGEALTRLERERDPFNALLLALLRFCDLQGFLPVLDGCSVCRLPVTDAPRWWLHLARGLLLCPAHRGAAGAVGVDLGTLLLVHQVRAMGLRELWRLRIRHGMKEALCSGILEVIGRQVDKELKSARLLRQIGALP